MLNKIMKINPLKIANKISNPKLSKAVLNTFLSVGVPFNAGLGLRVVEINASRVRILSPSRWKRRNHLGSAHACAIAVLCEVPAGLMVLQKYPLEKYRFILGGLTITYHKQGRGPLYGDVMAPTEWPMIVDNGEIWVEFETKVTNKSGELVAEGRTKWQIKPWSTVRANR
jgi:acyl-coenzyme A thioesterase PaaI-like protein